MDGFPDRRRGGNATYPMGDIGMAAFSVFFMQSPSFLAHQRQFEAGHGRSNCTSLFGIAKVPCDNHIRSMLDPAPPHLLHPMFAETVDQIRRIDGGLDMFRRLDGRLLIALDGSEYHCSRKIHCRHCSTRLRGKGETEYFHSMLAATLVAPGHDKVIPLEPEFITPQDGAEKQDCENAAAKRWLAAHGRRYAALGAVYLGDDLFSRQPLCQAVLDTGGHFIFVCKPSSHPLIEEYLTGIDLPMIEQTVKRGKQRFVHRYRWLPDVPLRDGKDALRVNWFDIEIVNAKGETTYRNGFVTDLPVGADTVAELAACGRSRWKIENETFNVLKTNGYNLDHNFGHGKQNLAAILVSLNLLAFALHTVCDIGDELWRAARAKLGPRYNFFSKLAAITSYLIFPSWEDLLLTLAFAKPPPIPP
nr:ISNCY family transposase [uncultured Rhodopila sp.]